MKELKSFKRVVDSFKRLPSVGTKSAERMAYSLLGMEESDLEEFAASILELKNKIHPCPVCGIYTEDDLCEVCKDDTRDKETLIVVSFEKDVVAFEKVDSLHGIYHVLNGALSAVNGIGINDLRIDSLLERINNENIKEVILATNPTIEGETTALFLAKLLESYNVKVSRLAYGLPMGGHLDYADALTIEKALQGRTKLKE